MDDVYLLAVTGDSRDDIAAYGSREEAMENARVFASAVGPESEWERLEKDDSVCLWNESRKISVVVSKVPFVSRPS